MGPFVRIALRYGVGAVLGYQIGHTLASDPDIVAVATAASAALVGAATEFAYGIAKMRGWST